MNTYIKNIVPLLPEQQDPVQLREGNALVYKLDKLNISDYVSMKGLKRLPASTQNALITAVKCCENVLIDRTDKVGIFVGTAMSNIENCLNFLKDSYTTSAKNVSPLAFPDTVLNNVSGWISIVLGINGLNMTVNTGVTSALDALKVANDYILSGAIDKAIVVATEEISDSVIESDIESDEFKSSVYTEGAVAVLIDKDPEDSLCAIESINSIYISNEKLGGFIKTRFGMGFDDAHVYFGSGGLFDNLMARYLEENNIKGTTVYPKYGNGFSLSGFFKLIEFLGSNDSLGIIAEGNNHGNKSFLVCRRAS